MTRNKRTPRRYRKTQDRRVWVFSELNHDLTPDQLAKVIATAALEQARLEREAQADHETEHGARPEQGTTT
jgi:hypothetical protein